MKDLVLVNARNRDLTVLGFMDKFVAGNGGYPVTVYARAGKKVWASECFLSEVTVGDINQDLSNTALYDQHQYQAVKAKTWADKAYVMNEEVIAA